MLPARALVIAWLAVAAAAALREPEPVAALGAGFAAAAPALPRATLAGAVTRADVDAAFFEERVRPILEARCFECHGPDAKRLRGGLLMSGRAALARGGASGPALSEAAPERSLLLVAVRWEDPLLEMPPDGKLPDEELAVLERWVRGGAPWPTEVGPIATTGADELDPAAVRFFEERIRPLLVERCYACHGPERLEVKGGLRMGSAAALARGGLSGPVVVPGAPDESRLIQAVRYFESGLKMPPDEKLSERAIADLERWVELGAPWPDHGERVDFGEEGVDVEAGRAWWSFRPVERPTPPAPQHAQLVRNPIDSFVLARLEEAGLEPNARATPRELVRRASFALTGLPPTYEDVRAFEADPSDAALDAYVERLLASPEYGERWARHWLDLVRFAQTNGYERDHEKPFAWRYRDWVVSAFNEDKPYDRFVIEQLAGDELEPPTRAALVATGFYRIGVWDDEPDDPEQARYDELDDVVRTIGEGFLGISLACARCHDHKFDPFPQEDYYRTLAFLHNVRSYSNPSFAVDSPTLRPFETGPGALARLEAERAAAIDALRAEMESMLDVAYQRLVRRHLAQLPAAERAQLEALLAVPEAERDAQTVERLAAALPAFLEARRGFEGIERRRFDKLRTDIQVAQVSFMGTLDWGLVVTEDGGVPPPTYLLARGRPSTPTVEVQPGFVQVLCADAAASRPDPAAPQPDRDTSGRRLVLARWIASAENPLTARVIVNRVWQHHFGTGLVPTSNNFGFAGELPTHPQLLDWLASEFVARGWSLKQLQRLVVGSNTWRMSSRATNERAVAADPANELVWRQRAQRLEAEPVHDALCLASGALERNGAGALAAERGGRGWFPRLSRGALGGGSRPGEGWQAPEPAEEARRALYAYVKRTLPVSLFDVFDLANTSLPVGRRPSTTIPSQTLTWTNGELVNEEAARFAARVADAAGADPSARVRTAYRLALARDPLPAELEAALAYLDDQSAGFAAAAPPLVFRPRVPDRLERNFLKALTGSDVMFGPRDGWHYVNGEWGTPYNNTRQLERARGPAALREGLRFTDAVLSFGFEVARGTQVVGVLLRAEPSGDFVRGLELALDVERGLLAFVLHGEQSEVLAEAPAQLVPERHYALRVELAGDSVRAWLDPSPDGVAQALLEARDERLQREGLFGVRIVGEGVVLDGVGLTRAGETVYIGADDPGPPDMRALESLCLALVNLNEFLYVD